MAMKWGSTSGRSGSIPDLPTWNRPITASPDHKRRLLTKLPLPTPF